MFNKKRKSIREITVESLHDIIDQYDKWYSEHGLYLPPDYENDPSEWTEALHKINRAFELLNDRDRAVTSETEQEVRSGLFLFGKYLYWMTDIPK